MQLSVVSGGGHRRKHWDATPRQIVRSDAHVHNGAILQCWVLGVGSPKVEPITALNKLWANTEKGPKLHWRRLRPQQAH
eukprot:7854480-Alexandrium_andersonii.AAC.1